MAYLLGIQMVIETNENAGDNSQHQQTVGSRSIIHRDAVVKFRMY